MISHQGGLWPLLEAAKVSGAHVASLLHGVPGMAEKPPKMRGKLPACALSRGVCTQLSSSPKTPYLHPSLQRDEIKTRAGLLEEGREGRSKDRSHGAPEPAAPRGQGRRPRAPQTILSTAHGRQLADHELCSSPSAGWEGQGSSTTSTSRACSHGQRWETLGSFRTPRRSSPQLGPSWLLQHGEQGQGQGLEQEQEQGPGWVAVLGAPRAPCTHLAGASRGSGSGAGRALRKRSRNVLRQACAAAGAAYLPRTRLGPAAALISPSKVVISPPQPPSPGCKQLEVPSPPNPARAGCRGPGRPTGARDGRGRPALPQEGKERSGGAVSKQVGHLQTGP